MQSGSIGRLRTPQAQTRQPGVATSKAPKTDGRFSSLSGCAKANRIVLVGQSSVKTRRETVLCPSFGIWLSRSRFASFKSLAFFAGNEVRFAAAAWWQGRSNKKTVLAPIGNRTFDSFAPGSVGLRPTLHVVHLGRPAWLPRLQQGEAPRHGEQVDSSAAPRRIRPAGCLSAVCLASRQLARLKDSKDPFRIVIVRDMWLTGFDAPCLHTMYADKPMQSRGK